MKKIFAAAVFVSVFFASHAFGACTKEEFQSKLLAVQLAMTAYAENMTSRLTALNDEMEEVFKEDLDALKGVSREFAQTPEGQQKVLDMGCNLYDKMTTWIKTHE